MAVLMLQSLLWDWI